MDEWADNGSICVAPTHLNDESVLLRRLFEVFRVNLSRSTRITPQFRRGIGCVDVCGSASPSESMLTIRSPLDAGEGVGGQNDL